MIVEMYLLEEVKIGKKYEICSKNRSKSTLQAIVDDMIPYICEFFESDEGRCEFEEQNMNPQNKKENKEMHHDTKNS